jgi:hypothetical protein
MIVELKMDITLLDESDDFILYRASSQLRGERLTDFTQE